MKNKRIIFIDLDGTILDVSKRIYQLYVEILKKYGKKFLAKKNYIKLKREKKSLKDILKKTQAGDISGKFKKEWKDKIEDPAFLNLDTVSFSTRKKLVHLKNNYKLVLVTLRNHPRSLINQLKKKKIDKIFDKILVKSARGYRLRWKVKYNLIQKYGKHDKYSIMIGDTETDILAGKKLKIKTVAVSGGMRNRKFLKKYKPDFLIKNIAEIKKYAGKI